MARFHNVRVGEVVEPPRDGEFFFDESGQDEAADQGVGYAGWLGSALLLGVIALSVWLLLPN